MEGLGGVGPGSGLIVLQVKIREHVERSRNDIGFIKANCQRASLNFPAVINLPAITLGRSGFGFALLVIGQFMPAKTKMPFAHYCGMITLLLQEAGYGESALLNQGFGQTPQHTFLECAAPVVTAGEDSITRGRAYRRSGV